MGRVVLVTGVSRYLGGRIVQALDKDPAVEKIIGVDVVPPRRPLVGAEFVRADIRSPIIAKVITTAEVDTVVHMSVIATPLSAGGRASMKEINVIGTMQLLAACQKAPSLERLVVKSSTAVYGTSQNDPAMFTEDMEPREIPRTGFAKDSVEVEGYVRGFARRRPDVSLTMLRLTNVVGPRIETALTNYLALPVVPTVLGFDARLQFLHEDDSIEALRRATTGQHSGTFNVSGDGVITLAQAIRRAGRPAVPIPSPAVTAVGQLLRRSRLADFTPEQTHFLSQGRGVDTSRMRADFGFEPSYTTREAFDDFVRGRRLRSIIGRDRLERLERDITSTLRREDPVDA